MANQSRHQACGKARHAESPTTEVTHGRYRWRTAVVIGAARRVLHSDHVNARQAPARHVAQVEREDERLLAQVDARILVLGPSLGLIILDEIEAAVTLHMHTAAAVDVSHAKLLAVAQRVVIRDPARVQVIRMCATDGTVRDLRAR